MAGTNNYPLDRYATVWGIAALLYVSVHCYRTIFRLISTTLNSNTVKSNISCGVPGLIGNTPLVRIDSLSNATGCEILAKAEFLNVGGSPKDRVALEMIRQAEVDGLLIPHVGCTIFEGTVGSTGISLATIARAKGYKCHIVMPDDIAIEKSELLIQLGATVEKVRQCSIVDKNHFVNIARFRATEMNEKAILSKSKARAYFCDQFENPANFNVIFQLIYRPITKQPVPRFSRRLVGK